jgi:hypothetical protein
VSNPRFTGRLHLAGLLLLVVVTTFNVPLTQSLTDMFQEAEYATFGFLAQTRPNFQMPVLIHGGLDVVPSRVAALICHANKQVVCVRTINAFLQCGAGALFVAVLATLVGLGTWAALLASLPAVAMLWLYNGPALDVVSAHQSTPGIRDLFVLTAVLLMARLCGRFDRGETRGEILSLLALGVVVGVGLFWAYNRGLLLGFVSGAFGIGLCFIRHSLRPGLLIAAGAVTGLAAILLAGGIQLITDTVFDITYWSQNASIWRLPLQLYLLLPISALTLLVLGTGLWRAWESLRAARPGRALMLAVLLMTYALYILQSLNRPDLPHLRWAIWPATLILAIILASSIDRTKDLSVLSKSGAALPALLIFTGFCIAFYSGSSAPYKSTLHAVLAGLYDNVRAMKGPAPTDRVLAGEDITRVADLVMASDRCTFAANNAGIIYLLSRVPPCTRYAFGAYIAADRQTEVIAALEVQQPKIILWDSLAWYSRIDGRCFWDRAPVLADWIVAHYPIQTAIGQYVILSRVSLSEMPKPEQKR